MNETSETSPLKKWRILRGLTQAELAERIGTSAVSISRWENNEVLPGAEARAKLCEVLKVKPEQLWFLQDEGESDKKSADPNTSASSVKRTTDKSRVTLWPPSIPDERYYHLPGREQDLALLLTALRDLNGTPMVALDALGGMGKTSMAVELSRRALRERLFEGVVGESAKQELFVGGKIVRVNEATLAFDDLLDAVVRQLGRYELLTMASAEKQAAIAQLLQEHRYLVLVDNLETSKNAEALVWHLHNLLGRSRALVTSRQQIRHDFVLSYSLKGLDIDDTLYFLQQDQQLRGGRQWQSLPREKLVEVHALTGGAPLALKLVNAQARSFDLDLVLQQLRLAGGQLYSFIFRQSWLRLSPTAQRVLIYIGYTAVSDVIWEELAAAGIGASEQDLLDAIDQLVSLSLLDVSNATEPVRYTIHPLTRQFVNGELPELWREQGLR
jgi:transcriptional regulator with XRE-family HTH domain